MFVIYNNNQNISKYFCINKCQLLYANTLLIDINPLLSRVIIQKLIINIYQLIVKYIYVWKNIIQQIIKI